MSSIVQVGERNTFSVALMGVELKERHGAVGGSSDL